MEPKILDRGKSFSAEISSDPPLSDCALSLFGSSNKNKLTQNIDSGKLITAFDSFTEVYALTASNLKPLKDVLVKKGGSTILDSGKESLYLRAKVECASGVYSSATVKLSLARSGSNGPRSVDAWISGLRKQVNKSKIKLENAFPALKFSSPVDLQSAPGLPGKLFVVEQAGRIISFDNQTGATAKSTFLDIVSRVKFSGEQGLLGLAFHPDFNTNGYFFVNYIDSNGDTVIARFQANADKSAADPNTEFQVLNVQQPFSNHNGGQLAFGKDGFLYIALGDGGSGGDPQGNAQNRVSLLGKLLRIDINTAANGKNYTIPGANPFAGNSEGFREEIYAYGLRNPWRFSFDSKSNDLWLADVGQGAKEEVDLIVRGGNYGWNIREGKSCYQPSSNCPTQGLIDPVLDYSRALGESVTGGYVYRGKQVPTLIGSYLYGDFSSGRLWAVKKSGKTVLNSQLLDTDLLISSFGQDANKELYILDYASGSAFKVSR